MDEQFILRVPPSVAERLDRLLSESENASSSDDKSLDLSFSGEKRTLSSSKILHNEFLMCLESKI
jgi:transcription initiation factor TFIID subunit 7